MRCLGVSNHRGVTLVEMMVAIGITSLILGVLAYLSFFTARNLVIINRQAISQTSCAIAAERLATFMRGAAYFEPYAGDVATTAALRRMKIAVPTGQTSVNKAVVAFNNRTKKLELYMNENSVSFDGNMDPVGTADRSFRGIERFTLIYESAFRVTAMLEYQYSGFAKMLNTGSNMQYGQFITDVIAKNHFLDQGGPQSYEYDVNTSGPASL
jgi:prepilin-type N-terminal cleavage/methylation domain-containing protein